VCRTCREHAQYRLPRYRKRDCGLRRARPPIADCKIKGVFARDGKCSYRLPGSCGFDRIRMDPDGNKRWFCSIDEAEAEGCRVSRQ
jgi:hypothetical protein